jgi:hypothetical protein
MRGIETSTDTVSQVDPARHDFNPPDTKPLDLDSVHAAIKAGSSEDELEDPTELVGTSSRKQGAPARVRADLPTPGSVFERTTADPGRKAGVERRLLELVDGVTPLKELASKIGVNTLRVQHLAAAAVKAGLITRLDAMSDLGDLGDIPDVDDGEPADDIGGFEDFED